MASTVGYIISTSCKHIIDDQHWLTANYTQFAVPYFIYDIYAMFLCHWHRYQVKGHESRCVETQTLHTAIRAYLHKELLMVIHHLFMVLVCFPVSVLWRQGKGDFFLGCMLMAELSTPFVCLGKVLILYKHIAKRAQDGYPGTGLMALLPPPSAANGQAAFFFPL
uniref:TLC domain-containing protein n=1 Tax=Ailuropoda melanoleuca TaxID=9646 RepID=A0A7N5JEX9_AILME